MACSKVKTISIVPRKLGLLMRLKVKCPAVGG